MDLTNLDQCYNCNNNKFNLHFIIFMIYWDVIKLNLLNISFKKKLDNLEKFIPKIFSEIFNKIKFYFYYCDDLMTF